MRPIGVVIIGFFYLMSLGYYLADAVFLGPAGIDMKNLAGEDIDPEAFVARESTQFSDAAERALDGADRPPDPGWGFEAVSDMIGLMTGTYFLSVLGFLGVPAPLVTVLQLIFGFVAIRTIVYYALGR